MKPFTSKHCTPINYGSTLNNNHGKEEKLKEKILETEKKAFIRSNHPFDEFEESRGERKAQRKLKRLKRRLNKHSAKGLAEGALEVLGKKEQK